MIISEIKLFELLKAKIGEKEAEAFVEILETKVDKRFEEAKATIATKEDVVREMANLKTEMEKRFTEQLKWMIVMWITQLGAIVTIIKFMIH